MKLIKENFVPLAILSGEQNRKDDQGEFIRQAGIKLIGAGGNKLVVTASGKLLGGKGPNVDVKKAWEEWKRLPASERKPGAVKIGERGTIDKTKGATIPPPGGLILKLYYRTLASEPSQDFRHVDTKDFVQNYSRAKNPKNPQSLDLDFNHVTRLQINRRLACEADTGGRAGEDEIPGL